MVHSILQSNKCQSFIGLLTVLVLFFSCSKKEISASMERADWPEKLQIAYLPDEEQPGRRLDMYRSLGQYLQHELGIEVTVVRTNLYGPVIEAMRSGKIDVAFFSAFSYLLASQKGNAESIVMRSEPDGSPRVYHSLIVVNRASPIQNFDQLIEQADQLVFSFVNPASTSGHLLPRAAMEQAGINPEQAFKEVVYAGSQNATIYSLVSKKADAASVSSANLLKVIRKERIEEDLLRVIWKSPDIPAGCTAVRRELPQSLKQAIRDAYIRMETRNPELFEKIQSIYREYLEEGEEPGGYIPCEDAIFDELRNLTQSIKGIDIY